MREQTFLGHWPYQLVSFSRLLAIIELYHLVSAVTAVGAGRSEAEMQGGRVAQSVPPHFTSWPCFTRRAAVLATSQPSNQCESGAAGRQQNLTVVAPPSPLSSPHMQARAGFVQILAADRNSVKLCPRARGASHHNLSGSAAGITLTVNRPWQELAPAVRTKH